MFNVGDSVVLKMKGTPLDGVRAMVLNEENDMGFLKVKVVVGELFGKDLVVSKYQLEDWKIISIC